MKVVYIFKNNLLFKYLRVILKWLKLFFSKYFESNKDDSIHVQFTLKHVISLTNSQIIYIFNKCAKI